MNARKAIGRIATDKVDKALRSRLESPDANGAEVWALPRGAHKVAHQEIVAAQRARILYAVVQAVARKGYAAVTLNDIAQIARLSKSTFYRLFTDKESCFLEAYETAHHELVAAVVGSQNPGTSWAERLRDSLRAYLRYNLDNPATARCFLVEIHAAGAQAWAKRDWGHERFARMQKSLYGIRRTEKPELPTLPDEIFLAVVAAVEEMVCTYVRRGQGDRIMDLEPHVLFFVKSVYSGHPEAMELLGEA